MDEPIFTKQNVLDAAAEWDEEPGKYGFGASRIYDVMIKGKAYPPKAIAAIALRLAGGAAMFPPDFPGKKEGKFHQALQAAGYQVIPKGQMRQTSNLPPKDNTIDQFRNVAPFESCERAFLVTGTQKNCALNLRQLKQRRSGNWQFNADVRGCVPGDALFVLLPSGDGAGGYPRTLFGGVIETLTRTEEELFCFHVDEFRELKTIAIDSGIRAFLGGRLPAMGSRVMTVWGTAGSIQDRAMNAASDAESFTEGAMREAFKKHVSRERDPRVIRQAKAIAKARAKDGKLTCQVCTFKFSDRYGDLGEDYIEGHHTKPISSRSPKGEETKVEDIALVCANCHRMLHRSRPVLTVEGLQAIVSETKATKKRAIRKLGP